jgi:hypothetical protein
MTDQSFDTTESSLSAAGQAQALATGSEALLAPRRPWQETTSQYFPPLTEASVLWLQPLHDPAPRCEWLKQQLLAQGLEVTLVGLTGSLLNLRRTSTLIIICVTHDLQAEMAQALVQLRRDNRSPIMLLTEMEDQDWSLEMLTLGADAVMAYATPAPVMLVRCLALLRRWRPAMMRPTVKPLARRR